MLRTRLYLGLLPLLLLIIATGGYAIHVCRDLAGSLSRDLVNNYRAILAAQQMRTSATLMASALSPAVLGEQERRAFEDSRGSSWGPPRQRPTRVAPLRRYWTSAALPRARKLKRRFEAIWG